MLALEPIDLLFLGHSPRESVLGVVLWRLCPRFYGHQATPPISNFDFCNWLIKCIALQSGRVPKENVLTKCSFYFSLDTIFFYIFRNGMIAEPISTIIV